MKRSPVVQRKTAIVFPFFEHYRAGVLKALLTTGREFILVAGQSDPLHSIKAWEFPAGTQFRKATGRYLGGRVFWQQRLLRLACNRAISSIIYRGDAAFIMTWLSASIARLFGKRVFFWTHGYTRRDTGIKRYVRKAFYHLSHGLLLHGHAAKIIALEEGFAPDRLYVIYNSLDYEEQKKLRVTILPARIRELRTLLFGNPDTPIVICTTRLTRVRRLDLLVEAVALLRKSGYAINILLVGDGPERVPVESLAAQKNIPLRFYGECYDEKILAELVMAADVTVAPGKVGLTAMHSLAFGVPVITHDTWDDQMPEWEAILPGKTGDVFRRDDIVSLSETIRRWTDSSQSRDLVRGQCINIIEKLFNPVHQAHCILRALDGYPANESLNAEEQLIFDHQRALMSSTKG